MPAGAHMSAKGAVGEAVCLQCLLVLQVWRAGARRARSRAKRYRTCHACDPGSLVCLSTPWVGAYSHPI